MPDPIVRKVKAWSGSPLLFRTRIVLNTGAAMTYSDCHAFSIYVYDTTVKSDMQELVRSEDLTTAPVDDNDGTVYDTLQTDYLLPDGSGYNFKYVLKPSLFEAEGGHTYRVEFKFTALDDTLGPVFDVWEIHTSPILSDNYGA